MLLDDKVYQVLKRIVQIFLPALASLYFGLGQIWHFPMVEEVIGSITVITTFLGVALGVSAKAYNASDAKYDGEFVLEETDEGTQLRLKNVDRDALLTKPEVTLKLNANQPLQPSE